MQSDAILALGRELTKELGLEPSVDTLGRWMAHYIAELIVDAEAATGEARSAKSKVCCDAILSLWQHRHQLPRGKRPFEDIEAVTRTLESLDPDENRPRYFRSARAAADEEDEQGEDDPAKFWLQVADGLDYSARLLIRYCLSQATQEALDKSAKWVALAEAAAADEGIEFMTIRLVAAENDLLEGPGRDDVARTRLQDRLKRLTVFAELAADLSSHLQQRLEQAQATLDLEQDKPTA